MRSIELKVRTAQTAVSHEIIAAPNRDLKLIQLCASEVEDETLGPLGLHASNFLGCLNQRVENDLLLFFFLLLLMLRLRDRSWILGEAERLQGNLAVDLHLVKET